MPTRWALGRQVAHSIVRQSGIYAIGNLAVKAAGLMLAPILLNSSYLSVGDYGYLALLLVTSQLCILTFGIGMASGLLRFYTDPAYQDVRPRLPFTALAASSVVTIVLSVALFLTAGGWLARLLLDSDSARSLIGWVLLYVTLKVIGTVALMHLRVTDRPGQYAALIVAEMLVLIGAAYVFLVELRWGLRGAVLAYVVAGGVSTAAAVLAMLPRVTIGVAPAVVRPLIRFGAPLVVASLSVWLLNVGDRYMLKLLSEAVSVGLYDFGSRVGGIVNLVFVQSFQLAFAVIGLRQFDSGKLDVHRAALRHYAVWTGWFVLALAILADDGMLVLVRWFGVDRFYLDIDQVVLPVAAGFWFYGIYNVAVNILYGLGRTRLIAGFVFGAAVLNVVLNFALIPGWGVFGAALATTLSFATLALLALRTSERLLPIRFDARVLVAVSIVTLLLWGLSRTLAILPAIPRLTLNVLLIALYAPLILAFRTYRVDDFRRGLRLLRPGLPEDGT